MSWHLSTIAAISTPLGTGGVGVISYFGTGCHPDC